MPTLPRWQAQIVDDKGNVLPNASIEVRDENTSLLVPLYSDRAGTTPIGNPFLADFQGFAFFHVATGNYKITASLGATNRVWRYVPLFDPIGTGTRDRLGAPLILYVRTDPAAVTIVPGNPTLIDWAGHPLVAGKTQVALNTTGTLPSPVKKGQVYTATIVNAGRISIPVDTTAQPAGSGHTAQWGDDANPGTLIAPFMSIQRYVNHIAFEVDIAGQTTVEASLAKGRYLGQVDLQPLMGRPNASGHSYPRIAGRAGTVAADIDCLNDSGAGSCFYGNNLHTEWSLKDLMVSTNEQGNGIMGDGLGVNIAIDGVRFGKNIVNALSIEGANLLFVSRCYIDWVSNVPNGAHVEANNYGIISWQPTDYRVFDSPAAPITDIINGSFTIASTSAFAKTRGGLLLQNGARFSGGSITGKRWRREGFGSFDIAVGGLDLTWPGTVAGDTDAIVADALTSRGLISINNPSNVPAVLGGISVDLSGVIGGDFTYRRRAGFLTQTWQADASGCTVNYVGFGGANYLIDDSEFDATITAGVVGSTMTVTAIGAPPQSLGPGDFVTFGGFSPPITTKIVSGGPGGIGSYTVSPAVSVGAGSIGTTVSGRRAFLLTSAQGKTYLRSVDGDGVLNKKFLSMDHLTGNVGVNVEPASAQFYVAGESWGFAFLLAGSGGAGFVDYPLQSGTPGLGNSAPNTPTVGLGTSGYRQYATSAGFLAWRARADTFNRTLDGTLTADRVYTLPDESGTLAFRNSKSVFFSRDVSLATGTQAITGVGFKPTSIIFFGGLGKGLTMGFTDSSLTAMVSMQRDDAAVGNIVSATNSILYDSSAGTYAGKVNSYDADGFTIGWTKTASPTGTLNMVALCRR